MKAYFETIQELYFEIEQAAEEGGDSAARPLHKQRFNVCLYEIQTLDPEDADLHSLEKAVGAISNAELLNRVARLRGAYDRLRPPPEEVSPWSIITFCGRRGTASGGSNRAYSLRAG